MDITREQIMSRLLELDLDWGDEEDAGELVDLLLSVFTPLLAWTWLCFWCDELCGSPLSALMAGQGRLVFAEACSIMRDRLPA